MCVNVVHLMLFFLQNLTIRRNFGKTVKDDAFKRRCILGCSHRHKHVQEVLRPIFLKTLFKYVCVY